MPYCSVLSSCIHTYTVLWAQSLLVDWRAEQSFTRNDLASMNCDDHIWSFGWVMTVNQFADLKNWPPCLYPKQTAECIKHGAVAVRAFVVACLEDMPVNAYYRNWTFTSGNWLDRCLPGRQTNHEIDQTTEPYHNASFSLNICSGMNATMHVVVKDSKWTRTGRNWIMSPHQYQGRFFFWQLLGQK